MGSGTGVAAHPVAQLTEQVIPTCSALQHPHRPHPPRTHTFHTIYDGADVLAESKSGYPTRRFQNGPGIDDKLSVRADGAAGSTYYHGDHLGTAAATSDAAGAMTALGASDSFGNGSTDFTGREYDAFTGLHYYRARMYDPQLGRFTSEDPIGFAGGDVNLYGYVGNNPINFRDPLGLWPTGSDIADWLDSNVYYARDFYAASSNQWYDGSVDAALISSVYDPLRFGNGVGYAMFDGEATGGQRAWAVGQDILRATVIYSITAGAASRAMSAASRGRAGSRVLPDEPTYCQFSGTEKPWTSGATPNSIYTHLDDAGFAKQNSIYDGAGDAIGHVDFKNQAPAPLQVMVTSFQFPETLHPDTAKERFTCRSISYPINGQIFLSALGRRHQLDDKDHMNNINAVGEFIERFSSFHDSFIRTIHVKYRHLGQVTVVTIVLSARDCERADNDQWVDVAIEIGNATEFNICESPKESYQVLSEGVKIAPFEESMFIDFGHFDELPDDPNEWRSSRFFVIGSTVEWSLSKYTD